MERNSNMEHLWDYAMPKKKTGLLKRTTKAPLTRKQQMASYNRDTGKSSLRKASEVPGAINKKSTPRMQNGGGMFKVDDARARDFLSSWLTSREKILEQNIKDYPNTTPNTQFTAKGEISRQLLGSSSIGVEPRDYTQKEIEEGVQRDSYAGEFEPGSRKIFINKNIHSSPDPDLPTSAIIHERTHALGSHTGREPLPQEKAIKAEFAKHNIPVAKNQFEGYQDKPDEIYSRIMEMRFGLKIPSDAVITNEDVEMMRADNTLYGYGLHRYPNEYIIFLLNKIAQADKPKPKTGGLLYG